MNLLNHVPLILQVILGVGVLLAAHAYYVTQSRLGSDKASIENNEILRNFNEDLKEQIKEIQVQHEQDRKQLTDTYQAQLDSMQKQITALQGQITSLQNQNEALKNTVMGKELLEKIQDTLDLFKPYIAAFSKFEKADADILAELTEIKKKISHVSPR